VSNKRDQNGPQRESRAGHVSRLEENTMLSDTISRPSIPVIDVLRAAVEARASAREQSEAHESGHDTLSSFAERLSLLARPRARVDSLPEARAGARKLLARLDRWAALAVVVLASSAVWYFGTLLIERWQLR
jgi:hypothetical protein